MVPSQRREERQRRDPHHEHSRPAGVAPRGATSVTYTDPETPSITSPITNGYFYVELPDTEPTGDVDDSEEKVSQLLGNTFPALDG